ncbi:unnamed protein product [Closterium sp. Naga37s-1]|nr:unnamed protein product [Closterium sp. Naga37s-1]
MSPVHHNHMHFNHYLQGFQLPAFQGGSWTVPSAVPALSPLPPRHEGADSASADSVAKAEMARVDSSTHINSLVAQYSFAQAGAAAAAACASHPVSPSQLVSPRTGWPHFAACAPFVGPVGPVSYAPGFVTIRSPKPAEGSASAGGSPSPSSHLPSLLESPLQSEVLPAESDGESFCKLELRTEQVDGEAETEPDESRKLLFPSEHAAVDGGAEGAEKAEQDLRVTKGTRRAMQLWLEGGAEGDVQGMGPFDWLDEPSGAEDATGLPHWVLAELGEGGAGKKSGEAVEEEVIRVLFRADSMESATGEYVNSATTTLKNEQHVTTPLHEIPLQAHEAKEEQYEDESTPTGTNKAVTDTPAGEEQGSNPVSDAGSADFGITSIGDLVSTGLVDKPSAQVLEDSSTDDIWHDVSALSDFLAASSSPIVDSELCLELQDVLRQEHVEYVVAPYEADAQMAYMCATGLVHAVITEDSDLIPYSCPRVLFKMDNGGNGDEIIYANVCQSQELALADFTPQMVLEMCILSGCDYLDSLPKIGLKTAHDWIRRHRNYRSALAAMKLNGRVVPVEYEAAFEQALLTFLHHRVYHLADELMTHVNPLPASLGPDVDLSFSLTAYFHSLLCFLFFPSSPYFFHFSFLPSSTAFHFSPGSGGPGRSPLQLPVQKNKLSKYFLPTAPAAKKQFQPSQRSPVTPPVKSAFEPSRPEAAAEPGPAGSANQPRGNSSGRGGRSVRTSAVAEGSAGPTAGEGLAVEGEGCGEPMVGEDLVQFMAGTVLEEQQQQQQQQPVAAGPRAAVARVFQRFTPPRSIAEAGTTPEPPFQRRQLYRRAALPRVSGDRQESTPTEWDQFVFRGNEGAQGEERAADGGERLESVLGRNRDLDGERAVSADLDADLDELLLPPAFDLVSDVPGSHEIRQAGRSAGGWRAGGWMGMRGAAGGARGGGGRGRGRGRVIGVGVGGAGSSRQQAETVFDSPKGMLGSVREVQGRGVRGRMGAAHVVVRQEMSCSTCVVDIDPFADPWPVGHSSDPLLPRVLPSISPFGSARPFSVREMQGEAEAEAKEEEAGQQQEQEREEESPFFRPARSSFPFAPSPPLPPSHCSASASLHRRPPPSPLPRLHPRRATTGLFTPTTLASPALAAAANPFASHVHRSRMSGATADGGVSTTATPAAAVPAVTAPGGSAEVENGSFWHDRGAGAMDGVDALGADYAVDQEERSYERECGDDGSDGSNGAGGGSDRAAPHGRAGSAGQAEGMEQDAGLGRAGFIAPGQQGLVYRMPVAGVPSGRGLSACAAGAGRAAGGGRGRGVGGVTGTVRGDRKRSLARGSAFFRGNAAEACEDRDAEDARNAEGSEDDGGGDGDGEGEPCGGGVGRNASGDVGDGVAEDMHMRSRSSSMSGQSFATDVSHVLRYSAVGKDAMGKVAAKLASFRHTPAENKPRGRMGRRLGGSKRQRSSELASPLPLPPAETPHTLKADVAPTPGPVNNRIGCLYRHLILAALLNRTLLVPARLPSLTPLLCQRGASGRACPSYPLPLFWDLNHTRRCLGASSVIRSDEFAARFGRPVEVNHMRCWHGPEGLCRPTYSIVKKNCLVGTALSYVAEKLRKKFGGRRVASDVVHAMLLNGSSLQPFNGPGLSLQSQSGVYAADVPSEDTEPGAVSIPPSATASALCLPRFVHVTDVLRAYGPLGESVRVLAVGDLVGTAVLGLPHRYALLQQTARRWEESGGKRQGRAGKTEGRGVAGGEEQVEEKGFKVQGSFADRSRDGSSDPSSDSGYSQGRNLWLDKDFVRPPGGRWLGSSGSGGLRDWLSIFQFLPGCRNTAAIIPPPLVFQRAQAIIRSLFGTETVNVGAATGMADSAESGTGHSGSDGSAVEVGAGEGEAAETGASIDADLPAPAGLPAFLAVHWRRGDFLQFCARSGPPGFCFYSPVQAAQCAADVARRNGLANVYVATDADDKEFQEFKETLGPEFTVERLPSSPSPLLPDPHQDPLLGLRQGAFLNDAASLLYTILDKVICVYSTVFLATPSSTLSNDVARIREGLGVPAAVAAAAAVGAEEEAVGESAEVRTGVDFGESTGVEEGRDGALFLLAVCLRGQVRRGWDGGRDRIEAGGMVGYQQVGWRSHETQVGLLSGGASTALCPSFRPASCATPTHLLPSTPAFRPFDPTPLLSSLMLHQVNNRIGCLYRHLILAALLNRTLLVPPVLLSPSLAYCKHGLSGSPCPSVPLPLIWDLGHTRTCLGGDTVLRTDEFAARFGRPLEVHHMRCWHGPEATCPMSNPGLLKNCLVNDTTQGGGGRRRLGRVSGMRKLSRAGVGMGAAAADAVRGWFGESTMAWVRGSRRRKLQQQPTLQGTSSPNRSPPLYTVQSFAESPLQTSAAHLHLLPHQLSPDVHVSANATASAVCFPRFVHVRDVLRAYAPLSSSVPVLAVGDLVFTAFLGLSERYEPFKERLFRYKRWREREEASQEREGTSTSNFDGMLASSSSQVILESDFLGPAGGRWLGSAGRGGLREWRSMFHFLPGCPVSVPILPPKEVIEDGRRLTQALFDGGKSGAGGSEGGGEGYVAVHWRRSDFKDYCVWSGPSGFCFYSAGQAGKCAADVARRNGLRSIYVASDANVEQFEEFQKAAGSAFKVIRYPDNPSAFLTNLTSEHLISNLPASIDREEASLLLHMLLDKLICVRSTVFLATMSSTLSNDVARMREGFGVPAALAAAADPGAGIAGKMAATNDAPGDVGLEFVVSLGIEERRDGGLCEGEKVWQPLQGLFGWMKDMKAKRMVEHAAGEWRR